MDFNDIVLELVTFDDGDPLEGPSSTPTDADRGKGISIEDEEEGDEKDNSDNFVDSRMEDY